jgi:membrane-associated protease RseP (regulator of RpoE activity)
VCVKRISMHDVNLKVFDFDYDLTWWAFVIDPYERIYSRYGSDDNSADRLSVAGLKHTLKACLEEHKLHPPQPRDEPVPVSRPMDLFGVKGKCMHCHQVNEAFYKAEKKPKGGMLDLDKVRFLPIPEDIGLTLSIDEENQVLKVAPGSAADKAGIRPGDVLQQVRGTPIRSQGDVMWTLKYAPKEGPLTIVFARAGRQQEATVNLPSGWKNPDLSWRRSARKLKR